MIKRLIFDLDNTLIFWKDEYVNALRETMSFFDVNCDYKKIDAVLEKQELIHEILTKEDLLNDINNECNLKLEMPFVDMLLEKQKSLAFYDKDLKETLDELSKKYELVLLTNWFKDTQLGRLSVSKVDKLFIETYAGDEYKMKPNKETFIKACGKHKPEECIMIGDNIDIDIKVPEELKMKVILVDLKNKYTGNKYIVIKNISELRSVVYGIK